MTLYYESTNTQLVRKYSFELDFFTEFIMGKKYIMKYIDLIKYRNQLLDVNNIYIDNKERENVKYWPHNIWEYYPKGVKKFNELYEYKTDKICQNENNLDVSYEYTEYHYIIRDDINIRFNVYKVNDMTYLEMTVYASDEFTLYNLSLDVFDDPSKHTKVHNTPPRSYDSGENNVYYLSFVQNFNRYVTEPIPENYNPKFYLNIELHKQVEPIPLSIKDESMNNYYVLTTNNKRVYIIKEIFKEKTNIFNVNQLRVIDGESETLILDVSSNAMEDIVEYLHNNKPLKFSKHLVECMHFGQEYKCKELLNHAVQVFCDKIFKFKVTYDQLTEYKKLIDKYNIEIVIDNYKLLVRYCQPENMYSYQRFGEENDQNVFWPLSYLKIIGR